MQCIVISNLRATRLAFTGSMAVVRAKSNNISAKSDIADLNSAHHNRPTIGDKNNKDIYSSREDRNFGNKTFKPFADSIPPSKTRLTSAPILTDHTKRAPIPSYKIRAMIQYDTLTPECINLILRFIAAKQVPETMLGLVEEKALSYLTLEEDDDLVTKFVRKTPDFDYDSICELFMGLASNCRRPTPLLQAAAIQLCKLPQEKTGDPRLIAGALSALASLNYPNKPLIARLMKDFTVTSHFDNFAPKAMCNLLMMMRNLRWRHDKLLQNMIDHLSDNPSNLEPRVMVSLMQVLAYLDYPVSGVLQQLHRTYLDQGKEESIKKSPKTWLNYVWSLVALKLANKAHLKSVLSDEFCIDLNDPCIDPSISFSDARKLLNLRVLAEREYELDGIDCAIFEKLVQYKIQRSTANARFYQKIENALQGIVGSKEKMLSDVTTPYGFTIDFELALDQNSHRLLPIDTSKTLEAGAQLASSRHLAVILASYDDTLANLRAEPVGYTKMISRIFKSFGYQTVFLPEVILNREKTSTDLTHKLRELLVLPGDSVSK